MRRATPILLALASGAATALAFPLAVPAGSLREIDPAGHLELVAWVSLVPALWTLERARSGWRAAGLGLVAGLACFFGAIWWVSHAMTAFGGLSVGFSLFALSLLVLFMAAHWAGAFAVAWTIRRRLGWPLWAHLPLAWTAFELLRDHLFTGFPWANLGYAQVRHLRVAQLASLFGVYGIAALVVFVNAVVAEALQAASERRRPPWRLLAAAAGILALVVGYGELHLRSMRERMASAPQLTVALVQPNVNQEMKNAAGENAEHILSRLVPLTVEADRAGADLVAWPVAAYPYAVRPGISTFDVPGAGVPRLAHAHLLLGATTLERIRSRDGKQVVRLTNTAFLLSPDLAVVGSYGKHHLVPFGEYVPLGDWFPFIGQVVPSAPASPGRDLTVLAFPRPGAPTPTGPSHASAVPGLAQAPDPAPRDRSGPPVRLAPMICFDAIFPEINVDFARQAPDLLVNPTNDAWYGYSSGPYQFLAIVRMRAIEAGRSVARPAYAGVSALILPTGEVAPGALEVGPVDPDLAPDPSEPARLLLGKVPVLGGRTLYTRIGDAFAYGCAALSGVALLAAWRARAGTSSARSRSVHDRSQLG
jgi:apolipoprotein N-acyltransferase